tara:strand:+ start:2372 stop:3202 length:831 start_codon:yes stop_codon:yes gene_type:complete
MHSKLFLQQNIEQEAADYFGYFNTVRINEIVDMWHDHSKKVGGRWTEIESFGDHKGKILDMACGVGTFLFFGLNEGYDVYGLEPEQWKLSYMDMKINELNYPSYYKDRIVRGVGESIPFDDNYFDLVTTWQTLEHVQNVEKTLDELVRVLNVGGKLLIQAPDYDSFYEPHYCLPFLPKMNRILAKIYLKTLGRPTAGLDTLNWTTNTNLKKYLSGIQNIKILDLEKLYFERYKNKRAERSFLPRLLSDVLSKVIYYKYIFSFQKEKQVKLVVWKLR